MKETKNSGQRVKLIKTGAGRPDITLPAFAVEALAEHRREQLEFRLPLGVDGKPTPDSFVFPALDGGPRSPNNLSSDWREFRVTTNTGFTTCAAPTQAC